MSPIRQAASKGLATAVAPLRQVTISRVRCVVNEPRAIATGRIRLTIKNRRAVGCGGRGVLLAVGRGVWFRLVSRSALFGAFLF